MLRDTAMPRRDERAQLAYERPMQAELLARGAEQIGIRLSDRQLAQFAILASELAEWNRRASLTRIDDPEQIQIRHFLDSLTCALPVLKQLVDGVEWTCIDVGSGAGFPGLPLAIAFPALSMTLLEATGKKVRFLEHAVGVLGLSRATVLNGRAEELARGAPHRDAYDLAVARALAPLPVALELCLPFVRPGGWLILPRGSDLPAQLESGRDAARALGARLLVPRPIEVAGLPPNRTLVVAEKTAPTPGRYPRRIGVAAKRPLDRPKLPLA
jgi:16S rRNA (guanine527-N7)-methyltransferase